MPSLISIRNLTKEYKNSKRAINNLSVDIEKGQITALIGSNGAGKTTFIHMLAGLIHPTSGTIGYNEQNPSVGWVSQHQVIDWFITVKDNVLLGARLAGMSLSEANKKSEEVLDLLELSSYKNKRADELSGGQQQRMQIARALVHDPKILILDEPTTGLDLESSIKLMKQIKERVKQGCTAIISSHDLNLLEQYADKILLINNGQLVSYEDSKTFMEKINSHEQYEFEYSGEIPETVLSNIKEIVAEVSNIKPLKISVSKNINIEKLLLLLCKSVNINSLKHQKPGLIEAYLAYKNLKIIETNNLTKNELSIFNPKAFIKTWSLKKIFITVEFELRSFLTSLGGVLGQLFIEPFAYSAFLVSGIKGLNENLGNTKYIDFAFPGVLAVLLIRAFARSIYRLTVEKRWGLQALKILNGTGIAGYLIGMSLIPIFTFICQGFIALIVCYFLGAQININNLLQCIIIGSISIIFWISLGTIMTSAFKNYNQRDLVINLSILPLTFCAPVFYETSNMPVYMQIISQINPLSFQVNSMRSAFLNYPFDNNLMVTIISSFLMVVLAVYITKRAELLSSEK